MFPWVSERSVGDYFQVGQIRTGPRNKRFWVINYVWMFIKVRSKIASCTVKNRGTTDICRAWHAGCRCSFSQRHWTWLVLRYAFNSENGFDLTDRHTLSVIGWARPPFDQKLRGFIHFLDYNPEAIYFGFLKICYIFL